MVLQTLVLYLFLILFLSVLSHRQTSELGIVELVVIALLGSAVETGLVAGNKSLPAGLVSVTTLLVANYLISRLFQSSHRLRRLVVGRAIPLVYKGQFLARGAEQAGLTVQDVQEGVRERGYENFDQVRLAMLEIDGTISVVPMDGAKGGS